MRKHGFEPKFSTILASGTLADNFIDTCRKFNVICGLVVSNEVQYLVARLSEVHWPLGEVW
jgi:hypothetical protein